MGDMGERGRSGEIGGRGQEIGAGEVS